MKRKNALASGNAINSANEMAVRVQLGTRIASKFLGVGLEQPLPEIHLEVGPVLPAVLTLRREDTFAKSTKVAMSGSYTTKSDISAEVLVCMAPHKVFRES